MDCVTRPQRQSPLPFIDARSNQAPRNGKRAHQMAHSQSSRVPSTRCQSAEEAVLGSRFIEVKGLRIKLACEGLDLVRCHYERLGAEHQSRREVFEIHLAHGCPSLLDYMPDCCLLRGHQKRTFNANWICLEFVTVEVICPAAEFGAPVKSENSTRLGNAKLGWFNMLNPSARNCAVTRSVILVSFSTARSKSENCG